MALPKPTFWSTVRGPIFTSVFVLCITTASSWVIWVSNGVADVEKNHGAFTTVVEKMHQDNEKIVERIDNKHKELGSKLDDLHEDVSYLRGWVDQQKSKEQR